MIKEKKTEKQLTSVQILTSLLLTSLSCKFTNVQSNVQKSSITWSFQCNDV